jgi:hypothetical protein
MLPVVVPPSHLRNAAVVNGRRYEYISKTFWKRKALVMQQSFPKYH